jgi:hypothetical protein
MRLHHGHDRIGGIGKEGVIAFQLLEAARRRYDIAIGTHHGKMAGERLGA